MTLTEVGLLTEEACLLSLSFSLSELLVDWPHLLIVDCAHELIEGFPDCRASLVTKQLFELAGGNLNLGRLLVVTLFGGALAITTLDYLKTHLVSDSLKNA